jgi:cytochrome b
VADQRPRVWDPLLRLLHWALALSILLAWLTAEGGGRWHEWIGYGSLAVVALRLVWGWAGPRYARFSQFLRPPAHTLAYARRFVAGGAPRYIGHNPLGAWMIVALLLNVALAGLSGWLYTTDRFWGVEWVEDMHEFFAESLLALIALHVGGVLFASWKHGENLVAAMLHGRKRAAGADDVE